MPAGRIVAGMDIGNSTTEVLLLERNGEDVRYVAGAMTPTTGVKDVSYTHLDVYKRQGKSQRKRSR